MIQIKSLYHGYNKLEVIKDLTINFNSEEITAVLGPSGCGKSTLLNIIAKLVKIQTGEIKLNFKKFGYLQQDPVLLPWLRIKENIFLPYKIQGEIISQDLNSKYEELIKEMKLQKFQKYFPWEISGGMKAKVTLIRNLLYSPEVLLMDEPFSNLDEITRENMQLILLKYKLKYNSTIILITHSIDEAILISDRIIVLSDKPAHIIADINPKSEKYSELKYKIKNLLVNVITQKE